MFIPIDRILQAFPHSIDTSIYNSLECSISLIRIYANTGSGLLCQIEMNPLRVKIYISANFPNTCRNGLREYLKLHLECISSSNNNEIYPQVTILYSQVVQFYVTQKDPGNQKKNTIPFGYRSLIFRTIPYTNNINWISPNLIPTTSIMLLQFIIRPPNSSKRKLSLSKLNHKSQ